MAKLSDINWILIFNLIYIACLTLAATFGFIRRHYIPKIYRYYIFYISFLGFLLLLTAQLNIDNSFLSGIDFAVTHLFILIYLKNEKGIEATPLVGVIKWAVKFDLILITFPVLVFNFFGYNSMIWYLTTSLLMIIFVCLFYLILRQSRFSFLKDDQFWFVTYNLFWLLSSIVLMVSGIIAYRNGLTMLLVSLKTADKIFSIIATMFMVIPIVFVWKSKKS